MDSAILQPYLAEPVAQLPEVPGDPVRPCLRKPAFLHRIYAFTGILVARETESDTAVFLRKTNFHLAIPDDRQLAAAEALLLEQPPDHLLLGAVRLTHRCAGDILEKRKYPERFRLPDHI